VSAAAAAAADVATPAPAAAPCSVLAPLLPCSARKITAPAPPRLLTSLQGVTHVFHHTHANEPNASRLAAEQKRSGQKSHRTAPRINGENAPRVDARQSLLKAGTATAYRPERQQQQQLVATYRSSAAAAVDMLQDESIVSPPGVTSLQRNTLLPLR